MHSGKLTEENFALHLNTKFFITLNEKRVELDLAEVKGYRSEQEEQQGMERFSIYFNGPSEPMLPQGLYSMDHELIGSFEIFIVPLGRRETSARYEAVFNYFK
jgi:hypothetical protein